MKVQLVKSPIGIIPKHKKTVQALGLRKVGQIVEKQDNAQMRGMIQQVSYLLKVVE